MIFDWHEYLVLAEELVGQSANSVNNEARLRSSISRAYYAGFCMSRNHLKKVGRVIPRSNTHQYVINAFRNDKNSNYRQIGQNLHRLRIDRNKADYEDHVSGLESTAITAIKLAQDVFYDLKKVS